MTQKPLALIILDGFGYSEDPNANAILAAKTPTMDHLWKNYPHTLISGSGLGVGLPDHQMGNSEVGHLNIGSGRVIYQDFTRIEQAIEDQSFFSNSVFVNAINKAVAHKSAVHILGLLSPGGVHSHENHIHALLRLAKQKHADRVYVHAFLDGRDTPPRSAAASITALENTIKELGCGKIASIIGRYYAMDRDHRWERVQAAYDLLTQGKAQYHATSAIAALEQAYARGENDEFVHATSIHGNHQSPITMQEGDVVIFMNYRADRARELTHAFTDTDFIGFERPYVPQLAEFVTLTRYATTIEASIAFPPQHPTHVLGECIAAQGLKQLRIAETEKYAHVTFFFNGGNEHPFPGEERVLIPSPKIATYDLQPEMSAILVTDELVKAIKSGEYALLICNFANADMVGHTGNFDATVQAIEVLDACIKRIMQALQEVDGEMLITADHGNAEKMFDPQTEQAHTAHTSEPVPFIYMGRAAAITKDDGALADVAPTILYLMNIPQPVEMTGKSLLKLS